MTILGPSFVISGLFRGHLLPCWPSRGHFGSILRHFSVTTSEDRRCIAESAEALGTQTPPPIPSAKYKKTVFCSWRLEGVRNPELPRMAEARGTRLLAVLWLLSAVSATLWPSWGHLGAILGHYCGHLVAILAISRLFGVYLAAFQCHDFGRRTLHSRFRKIRTSLTREHDLLPSSAQLVAS